ncbi:MAG TPA: patatin-like phospholipase family protein [Marmoricola sp.]|nr:patatin-like phospholipase family protein [Marmoricola sp.]
MSRTLVLGGGGVTGVAWELGVLEGLRRAGVDLAAADTVIGTSAGSVVGARLVLGGLEQAYAGQLEPPTGEIAAKLGPTTMIRLAVLMARRGDEEAKFKRIGKAARAVKTETTVAQRMAVIRARIGDPEWPEADLRITAIDIDNGRLQVFDRASGVRLLEAVAASCAVPLVWPPVTIGATTYVDGGARSPVNADLATGADVVIAIAPIRDGLVKEHHLDKQLERTGAPRTTVVAPDHEATAAMGSNSLDPAYRAASAVAGLRQGALVAEQVGEVWG